MNWGNRLFENEPGTSIEGIEQAVHAALEEAGLKHRGEWFVGGAEKIISIAKRVIKADGAEFETCRSMLRRLKMWKIEAEEKVVNFPKGKPLPSSVRTAADRMYSSMKRYGATKARW